MSFKKQKSNNNSAKIADTNQYGEAPSESLGTKLKNLCHHWVLSSSSHGLPRIFQTDQIYLKILWAIAFISSAGLGAYIVVNYIITFTTFGVDTTVSIVYESPTTFPALTICNLNPFYKRRSQSFIDNTLAKNNMMYVKTLNALGSNASALALSKSVLTILKTEAAVNQSLSTDDRKNLGFFLDDMLLSCTFDGNTCSSTGFSWFQSYEYGNCYTFNIGTYSNGSSASLKATGMSGPESGLEMEIFVGDPAQDEDYIYKSGLYVVVHNQSVTPLMENEGFHVAAGYQTNVAVTRTFINKLDYPYSTCIKNTTSSSSYDSDLYRAIFTTLGQKTYRQKYCYKMCYQKYLIQNCTCFDPEYDSPYKTYNNVSMKPCMSTTETNCKTKFKTLFQSLSVSDKCSTDCPLECYKVLYNTNLNTAHYPTTFYSRWLLLQSNLLQKFQNNQTNSSQIENCILKLNVYYDDLTYTLMAETASLTWDTLLGNVGGTFGLFLGISALSFFECIVLVMEIIRHVHIHRNHKQTNPMFTKPIN